MSQDFTVECLDDAYSVIYSLWELDDELEDSEHNLLDEEYAKGYDALISGLKELDKDINTSRIDCCVLKNDYESALAELNNEDVSNYSVSMGDNPFSPGGL